MRRVALTVVSVLVLHAVCPADDAKATVTRADLALALQRFEKAFLDHRPTGQALIDANDAFEEVTQNFFRLNLTRAIALLNDKALELSLGRVPSASEKWLASLKVVVDPSIVVVDERGISSKTAEIRIAPLYPAEPPARRSVRILLHSGDKSREKEFELSMSSEGVISLSELMNDGDADWRGAWEIKVAEPSGLTLSSGRRLQGVPVDLDLTREKNAKRLASVASAELNSALATARARNEILKMAPSEARSTEFLADYNRLLVDLESEITALEEGRDPYAHRPGDLWRVLEVGQTRVPLRIYCPEKIAKAKNVPLVIALHGAGGDENMFMDAYGLGEVKCQADRRGFIVVSPATFFFSTRSDLFKPLVDDVALHYAIDRKKVYVLGHSMGGAATAKQAADHPDAIAAAACIAGFRGFGKAMRIPPALILAAERDVIVPARAIEEAAMQAKAAGLPVEYRLIPHYGHTLVVEAELGRVVDWLLAH